MLILSLDTTGDVCSLCVAEGSHTLGELYFRHARRLSERLPRLVDFLLHDAGASLRDVEAFAVGAGPGSFTGVRVGVTTAKTLAHALGRSLVGISSLDALAEPFLFLPSAGIVAVVPARRDEVVAGFYRAGAAVPVAKPAVIPVAEVLARAAAALGEEDALLVCGEAAPALPPSSRVGVSATPVSAASVARLAARRLERGETDDPLTFAPYYVTPSPVG